MENEGIPSAVDQLANELAQPKPMRRGSVSERWMKCGKKECRCHEDAQSRHGPYFSLTRSEGGKTHSRYLSAQQAQTARRQVQAGQQFRKHLEAYWLACEQWADARLDAPDAASPEAFKKGGSRKPSALKSRPRSKRS